MVCLSRLSMVSPFEMRSDPRNVLCEQCSLQVWARVSSSQSVGLATERGEMALDRLHLGKGKRELPRRLSRQECLVVETSRIGTSTRWNR